MSSTRPGLVLERDPVADPDRLRDREHDPGDEVADRLARGEADDEPEHGARGEDPGRRRFSSFRTGSAPARRRSRGSITKTSRRISCSRVWAPRDTPPSAKRSATWRARASTKRSTAIAIATAIAIVIAAETTSPWASQKLCSMPGKLSARTECADAADPRRLPRRPRHAASSSSRRGRAAAPRRSAAIPTGAARAPRCAPRWPTTASTATRGATPSRWPSCASAAPRCSSRELGRDGRASRR